MSDLSSVEKAKLEKLFDMKSGYVLDFSNSSFQAFIIDSVNIDIYGTNYGDYCSKANKLRIFWDQENNKNVAKLTKDLIEVYKLTNEDISISEKYLIEDCLKIVDRLEAIPIVENIDSIEPLTNEKDFILVVDQIKSNIKLNKPEASIDRLHTYMIKFIRLLSKRHNIKYDKNKPLHSLFGEYIKKLNKNGKLKTLMTERILKNSISLLESYNKVRNNDSLAHDNPILSYDESLLILNNISNLVKFINTIENDITQIIESDDIINDFDDMPF